MQMILGGFVFGLRETGVAYQQLQRSTSQRIVSNDRVGQMPAYQNLGPENDEVTLQGVIAPEICGDLVQNGLTQLREMMKTGSAFLLIMLDTITFTGDIAGRWIIKNVDENQSEMIGAYPQKIEFTIKLQRIDESSVFDALRGLF